MMGRTELCAWLRANSSGIYRPAAEAADEIEYLARAQDGHFRQAMENGARANALAEAAFAVLALSPDDSATEWNAALKRLGAAVGAA